MANDQSGRATDVREELLKLKKIILNGGRWRNSTFKPYTGTGNAHVLIISDDNFLTFLSGRDELPGKNILLQTSSIFGT